MPSTFFVLCLIDAFFRLAFHRCSLSFRSRFASCATLYTLSRFFTRFFKSSLSLRPLPVFVVSFYELSLSSSCLYLINTLRSRSIFILPLHALFRLPSSTRFTLDLPPSRSHIASLQLSWIRLCFSSPSLSFSFSSQPLRVSLFDITLAPCPLPSSLFSLFIYHSSRALPLSFSLFLSQLSPTNSHAPSTVVKRRFRADWSCALGDAAR